MAHRTPPTEHPNTGRTLRRWLWPGAAALAVALLLTGLSPLFPRLGGSTGDAELGEEIIEILGSHPVSYTHLTLPTNREV